jgi:hypothetical protein
MKRFLIYFAWPLAFLLAAILLLLATPSFAHDIVWHKSTIREPSPSPAIVFEVDNLPDSCFHNRISGVAVVGSPLGCYIPWSKDNYGIVSPGYILLAKRLNPWTKECVIEHERKHDAGLDHDDGWGDC